MKWNHEFGFDGKELSTQGGFAGLLFLMGMEVMPEDWKKYFVVFIGLIFFVQIVFKEKAPQRPKELSEDLDDLIEEGRR